MWPERKRKREKNEGGKERLGTWEGEGATLAFSVGT